MKRLTLQFLFALSCSLVVACGQAPQTPNDSSTPTPSVSSDTSTNTSASVLFPNALSKRSLSTEAFANAQSGNNTAGGATSVSEDAATSAPAVGRTTPAAAPMVGGADMAEGAKMIMPGYFGNPFEQVELKFVEELTFSAAQGTTLLSTYRQDLMPLVNSWDANARLLMSAASEGEQYYYLPNASQEPEQMAVKFSFQWVSNDKKETLMLYVLDQEIRMHRMVWGAPNIDLSKVSIDTAAAQERVKQAFADRSSDPGYPVYPVAGDQDPNIRVLYEIPANAQWDISLNEQQGKLRYFISVNFKVENPSSNQSEAYAGGFVEMDASTGTIEQLNRPTWYAWNETQGGGSSAGSDGVARASAGVAVSAPMPVMMESEEVR